MVTTSISLIPYKRKRGAVLLLFTFLAGCGIHPTGVMTPVKLSKQIPQTSEVEMLVATTRQPTGNPATLFSGERDAHTSLTDITVSIPPDSMRKPGTVQWPHALPPDPRTDFAVTQVRQLDTLADGKNWFKQHSVRGHAFVFIHGFNNRYEDSVFRFAQIIHDSGAQTTPILFTWPSRADVLQYSYDKDSTNYSRSALEDTLRVLSDAPDVKDITILAHSMGTWLAMEALRQMGIRDGSLPSKIKNVILASPDMDLDVFAKQWAEMGKRKPKFTIFVSQDDRALALSSFINGDKLRVGNVDPTKEPYRTQLEETGITAIDLTKIQTDNGHGLNHGKFAESPEIVRLIGQRLIKGQTLTDSTVSIREGIAGAIAGTTSRIGGAAAATLSAPGKIIGNQGQTPSNTVEETLKAGEEMPVIVN